MSELLSEMRCSCLRLIRQHTFLHFLHVRAKCLYHGLALFTLRSSPLLLSRSHCYPTLLSPLIWCFIPAPRKGDITDLFVIFSFVILDSVEMKRSFELNRINVVLKNLVLFRIFFLKLVQFLFKGLG